MIPLDNMGQRMTKNTCVDLYDLPEDVYQELISDSYTVVRTDGWEQTGWRIPTKPHDCPVLSPEALWEGSLAWPENDEGTVKWRVHMVFDGEASKEETKKHACGWRVTSPNRRTFWPTRLSDDPEAKANWWLRLDKLLNGLENMDKKEAAKKIEADMLAAFEEMGNQCNAPVVTGDTEPQQVTDKTRCERYNRASVVTSDFTRGAPGITRELPPVYPPLEPVSRDSTELIEQFRAITGSNEFQASQKDKVDLQNYLPLPEGKNLGHLLMDLEAMSLHDANRARRLLDCGCNKAAITNHCQITDPVARDDLIKNEEVKLFLEPLRQSLPR